MVAETQFAHIGMNHIIQTSRVLCVMKPNTRTAKKFIERAKERGMFVDDGKWIMIYNYQLSIINYQLSKRQRFIRWLLRRGPTSSHSEQRS